MNLGHYAPFGLRPFLGAKTMQALEPVGAFSTLAHLWNGFFLTGWIAPLTCPKLTRL
jgi:hypothetical protein